MFDDRSGDPLQEAATEVGKSAAQLLLSWALSRGVSVLPRSTNARHVEENARVVEQVKNIYGSPPPSRAC